MSKTNDVKKKTLEKVTVSRIMRAITRHEGFHFFKEQGDSTGKIATSLVDFAKKLEALDVRSVNFHFKRRDFEKWIRNIIGDTEVSTNISRIREDSHGEKLRNELLQIVRGRLEELTNLAS